MNGAAIRVICHMRKSGIGYIKILFFPYFKKKSYEVPESKRLAPTSDTIISSVCAYYGVSFNELLITRRGIFNEPRNIAVYLLRQIRGESLKKQLKFQGK